MTEEPTLYFCTSNNHLCNCAASEQCVSTPHIYNDTTRHRDRDMRAIFLDLNLVAQETGTSPDIKIHGYSHELRLILKLNENIRNINREIKFRRDGILKKSPDTEHPFKITYSFGSGWYGYAGADTIFSDKVIPFSCEGTSYADLLDQAFENYLALMATASDGEFYFIKLPKLTEKELRVFMRPEHDTMRSQLKVDIKNLGAALLMGKHTFQGDMPKGIRFE